MLKNWNVNVLLIKYVERNYNKKYTETFQKKKKKDKVNNEIKKLRFNELADRNNITQADLESNNLKT